MEPINQGATAATTTIRPSPPTFGSSSRRIVLHADDFGMNRSVTDGILRGFTHGLLTSTSLLANAPDAEEAIRAWERLEQQRAAGRLPSSPARRSLHDLDASFELGIHLNLTQGRPLTGNRYPAELVDDAGRFCGVGRLHRQLSRRRPKWERTIVSELAAQIEFLLDHGRRPTHLNGHQYIELLPGLYSVVSELLVRYKIGSMRVALESDLFRTTVMNGLRVKDWGLGHVKRFYGRRLLRTVAGWNVGFPEAYFGASHAARINLPLVERFLDRTAGRSLVEIGLHPALPQNPVSADGWSDPLAAQRPHELEMLTGNGLIERLHAYGISLGRMTQAVRGGLNRAA
jgi:chitin disaccharide deacetylase